MRSDIRDIQGLPGGKDAELPLLSSQTGQALFELKS